MGAREEREPRAVEHPHELLPATPGLEHFRLRVAGVESHAGNCWKEIHALGRPAPVAAFPAAADLAWYSARGIPGALFGPNSLSVCHAPNEFVPLDELLDGCKAIALVMTAWCGTG